MISGRIAITPRPRHTALRTFIGRHVFRHGLVTQYAGKVRTGNNAERPVVGG